MVEGHAKNNRRDYCHHSNYEDEHDGDKPGGAALVFWRWLGDAKGVNEGIRQKEQGAHGHWMILRWRTKRLLRVIAGFMAAFCIQWAGGASYVEALPALVASAVE